MKFRARAVPIALLALLVMGSLFSLQPSVFGTTTSPYEAQGFNVLNIAWGTSNTPGQAGPGDNDVPLTVTLQYIYAAGSSVSTSGTLDTSGTGFSPTDGGSNASVYNYSTLTAGTIFTLTFYLNLNSSVKVGSRYNIPLTMLWSAILTNSTLEPETSLIQKSTIAVSVNGDAHLIFETSQTYLTSGEVNSVNFTILNNGTGFASNIQTTLTSQEAGVQSVIPEIQNLTAGSSVTFPVQIYLPESSAGTVTPLTVSATFIDPYGDNASTSQAIDLHSSVASEPILAFSAQKITLVPGQSNNITITLTNMGSGNASNIITTTTGSLQGVSTLSDFPTLPNLTPGSSFSANITVYVPNSSAGQAISLTFSATYADTYGTSGSTSQNAGFRVASVGNIPSDTFSVSTIRNSVISGNSSTVSFDVKNIGNSTIYSPDYNLEVNEPLVAVENSSYSSSASMTPGQSQVFEAELSASPGSSSGVYPATLQISFSDEYGSAYNQTYPVSILLSGSVIIVVQDEAFNQNGTGITVTGNLLDEGSASAYYLSVYGTLNGSKSIGSSNYIGEVDPNTPVPFTLTIPYTSQVASSTGNISVVSDFKNSLGQSLNVSSSSTTTLNSSPQIPPTDSNPPPGSGSQSGPSIIELGIIFTIVLVAAGIGVFALIRRRENKRMSRSQLNNGNRPGSVS